MNSILSYLLEVAITLAICTLTFRYLRPFLKTILVDLCGTEERAQFWTVFSHTLLIGLPMILALAYQPEAQNAEELFFELARKISGNFGGFLFALLGAGMTVAFFSLFAPRTPKAEAK
ncbi:MAG: hypothetical protein AB1649_34510 [Chloroflexota bacterium]